MKACFTIFVQIEEGIDQVKIEIYRVKHSVVFLLELVINQRNNQNQHHFVLLRVLFQFL